MTDAIKLNIGAGATVIPGYTAVDRKLGSEAFPLQYANDSVEEIRASHILEHFSFRDVPQVLNDWYRVLQPGGRVRIAVPDMDKVAKKEHPHWRFALMGGQTNDDDFHRSVFDEGLLSAYLHKAGFVGIQHWESDIIDTATHPLSLNLEAYKPGPESAPLTDMKIKAVMSVPRIGWNDASSAIEQTLRPFNIQCERFNGVFWGQCMQRAFEDAVKNDVDWLLTFDYDSMPTSVHLDHMFGVFGENPHIDALAALQMRRGQDYPLFTQAGKTELEIDGKPILVHTAHFGMTLLRVESLKKVPKPWFWSKPDENGEWGDGRMDDDIYFWHVWRQAGNNIYVDPEARIGHLELLVSEYTEDMQPRHVHIGEWWSTNCPKRTSSAAG